MTEGLLFLRFLGNGAIVFKQSQVSKPTVLVQEAPFIQPEGFWLHSSSFPAKNCFNVILLLEGFHQEPKPFDSVPCRSSIVHCMHTSRSNTFYK